MSDVTALVAKLRERQWYTDDLADQAASELTRLAAENAGLRDAYGREALFSLPEMEELIEERDEAKAEVARLTTENRTYAEAHAFNSERFGEMLLERDEAKATIERLETVIRGMDTAVQSAIAERDEYAAEVARLRAFLEPFAESAAYFDVFGIYGGVPVRHLRDAREALKSNTGKKGQ